MGIRITIWDDDKTKQEISKRFQYSSRDRVNMEVRWKRNESILFSTSNMYNFMNMGQSLDYSVSQALSAGVDQSNTDVNVAYTFKNLRFIHAQMSANPPSVAMRPASSDQDDHRKADAADRITRWALRHYKMQEEQDQQNLGTLVHGNGVMKSVWDSQKGDITDFDPITGEVKMEGDIDISVPFIWNIYLDPDAKKWNEVKYVIERIYVDYEEACIRWPGKKDLLEMARVAENQSYNNATNAEGRTSELRDIYYNAVQLLEYWETGLASNGYLGRYTVTTITGDVIESCRPNPFRFRKGGAVSKIEQSDLPDEVKQKKIDQLPEQARLPYHLLTDIDVPNQVWGMSSVEYAAQLQDNLSRLDSSILDNIKAHGVARMIVPESCDIADDLPSNSPWDVTKISGNQPPYFMQAPALMPEMSAARNNYIQGINDVMGINEAMLGQQSREQSGASMQYATNQGNMIRRRLFNKYVMNVESVYQAILDLIRKHWTVSRTIRLIGKEKALEAIDIKGADIDGGFDIVGEYGVTLSLDPVTRREEILTLQPLFEKAGVPVRSSMKMLKLNELESMFDELDLAENRQKEIFDQMIAENQYIKPEDLMDHENMIAWAMKYFMTQEFSVLEAPTKQLLKQHIRERAQIAATEKPGGAPAPGAPGPAPAPPGPVPGAPAGPVPPPEGGAPIPAAGTAGPAGGPPGQ